MLSMQINRMSADEIVKHDPDLAIIAVGSIEQHGPHLPVITDWRIATALGEGVAEQTGGFLIPALPVSTCREQMGKKGSVWMNHDTFYHMMMDMIMSLKEQGFKKVCILQCHGGIFIMTPLVRELNAKFNPDLMVAKIDICDIFPVFYKEGIMETNTELHAGECETSLMLYLEPETVHMDKAIDYVPSAPRSYLNYGSIYRATPSGVWGEPTKASAEKGKRMMERAIELSITQMKEAFDYMANKERFGYSEF
jgi:creatinine amidohydrolase